MTIKTGTRQANYRPSTLYVYTVYINVKGMYPEGGFYSLDEFYAVCPNCEFEGLNLSLLMGQPWKQQRVNSNLEASVPR
jgi:hypothetical protein